MEKNIYKKVVFLVYLQSKFMIKRIHQYLDTIP